MLVAVAGLCGLISTRQDGSELNGIQGVGEVDTGHGKGLPQGRSVQSPGIGAVGVDQDQA